MRASMGTASKSTLFTSAGLLLASLVAPPAHAYERPVKIHRVSVTSDGAQAEFLPGVAGKCQANPLFATYSSTHGCSSDMTPDGRYVAFSSQAINLVPNDLNAAADVFTYDRSTGKIEMDSVPDTGLPLPQLANTPLGGSFLPQISDNGRFVTFTSDAPNMVPGDTNLKSDVFLHDRRTGATSIVSVSSTGEAANEASGSHYAPVIDGRGVHIAYASDASNLVTDDTNNNTDIFVFDRKAHSTTRVSVSSSGEQADGSGGTHGATAAPSISSDGRYVAFSSSSSNLVSSDSDGGWGDVFVRDLANDSTEIASVPTGSQSSTLDLTTGSTTAQSISADGRYVAFYVEGGGLIPSDSNNHLDVYVRDRVTQRTRRASVLSSGAEVTNATSWQLAISPEGRYVSYMAQVNEGGTPLGSRHDEIMVHDLETGATHWAGHAYDEEPGTCSITGAYDQPVGNTALSIGNGGRFVSFDSCSSKNVTGDTNARWDTFVTDRGSALGTQLGSTTSPPQPDQSLICIPSIGCYGDQVVALADDETRDARSALGEAGDGTGSDIYSASVAVRAQNNDLFFREELTKLPSFRGTTVTGAAAILYGFDFSIGSHRYQVRAQRLASDSSARDASFGLFLQDPDTKLYEKVASLQGGHGTTGDEVVFDVPLAALNTSRLLDLQDVSAFTAVGSYEVGAIKIIDSLALR